MMKMSPCNWKTMKDEGRRKEVEIETSQPQALLIGTCLDWVTDASREATPPAVPCEMANEKIEWRLILLIEKV